MDKVLNIIKDRTLTYEQKVLSLAREAENSLNVLNISKEVQQYRSEGIICDLFEGNAPYRPRYIIPDYDKFMREGSSFLGLKPPKNIYEAVNNLLILYKHVPSITSFPVYIGNIDYLLESFINDEEEAYQAIKLFLIHIDRTITDSFCHANIGPNETKAGRLILKAEREIEASIPNITLKYSSNTPDDFALDAINTALVTAKPSFANHEMFKKEFGENYGIASCYNGLPIGGGSYTLVRLNLAGLAKKAKNEDDFLNNLLPDAVKKMAEYMDERIKFLVEESGFFESSFLVREGLIHKEKFTAMFGMFGLAECVNHFINSENQKDRFGHGKKANDLGYTIISKLEEEVNKHHNPHCKFSNGKYLLHAQVGIDTDYGISPGCRIPIGEEPEIHEHIIQAARFHKFFPSGIGDIFTFDKTVKNNPEYILDIIKGAFKHNMRYFSFYSSDSDVIRITGYLVKKSEMEKLDAGKQVLRDTVALGLGSVKNSRILERKVRRNG
ncbi:glycine radical enzyme, YjjI family [Caminicella sporogenes DSM 14501]|uniref:Glycine radical enzyme, YjjI family n=1 Tax=Caminicella sporogenes DSM 14501 TaxID=1121266 RepID=A0A1M6MK09_9FIRM|nr:YjjI family glycine radical enzyme [Caminicella sporogenes]RKD27523.1 YjjI family glycine radical enzyme [Caminicella sporogenes]SHJ83603.1 glycine radical enzyme, YjjI family [Caminicella sporogenes DSM 14501]